MIRLASNKDSAEIIAIIDEVFREYGDRIFLEGVDKDLLDIERNYLQKNGAFWVYISHGKIVGTVAVVNDENHCAELKRVYLKKNVRGSGIADKMLKTVYEWCRNQGVTKLYFWSDIRFTRGHQFYEKHGFKKGDIRSMNDGYAPYKEYYFEKTPVVSEKN